MDRLRGRISELLKFTLQSHIDQTLGHDLGLSPEFCSDLLRLDPPDCDAISNSESVSGVPSYPLYRAVAQALYQSFCSGAVSSRQKKVALLREEALVKLKDDWNKLIAHEGEKLVDSMEKVAVELNLQEPFFSMIKDGLKIFEGRCAIGDYNSLSCGCLVLLNKCLLLEVQDVRHYSSFSELLEAEGLPQVLPGVKSIEEGVQICRTFYPEEKERSNGVLAVVISRVAMQPSVYLAYILSGLSYEGIRSHLGLAHTVGTILDAVPPSKSVLQSSFMLPFKPNVKSPVLSHHHKGLQVKGSTLSHGARALEKHTNRSSDKYWGRLSGTDSDKNRLAADIISNLIDNCCWINVHIVQPHGIVFEIRIAEGYGARWSGDGRKFIGFLEPYMTDGHSRGWRH